MSAFQLTGEQARATQPRAHIWVDASAGTGKTHVLSARVLRLMVEGAHPASILCLTYTKAASGEMTNRILGHLGRWATLGDTALARDLATLLGGASLVTQEHIARARRLFLDVLDLPMGLNVQTLHAFSQSLLGRFPIEAQTAPGFETIDARTAQELLGSSRDDLLAHAITGTDPELSVAARALARLLADKSFNDALKTLKHAETTLKDLPKNRSALLALIERALGLTPGQTAQHVMAAACEDSAFDGADLRAVLHAIEDGGTAKEKAKVGGGLAAWLSADVVHRAASLDTYAQLFLTTTWTPRAKPVTKGVIKSLEAAPQIMADEGARLAAMHETRVLHIVAQQTADALYFGQSLMTRYGAKKDNAAKLDFDDLIDRTRSLLEAADIPTWVMYKLDTQIDHILIDEAQDNSDIQWRIIDRLTQDFFVNQDPDRKRSIFAVGDMKQSIYGFQGAQPKLFDDTRHHVKAQAANAQHAFEDVPMAQSFRSVQAVLDVVDQTFADAAGTGLDAKGVTIKHRSYRQGMGGQVDLWPIMMSPKDTEEANGWRLPLFERSQAKADRAMAQRIADDIAQRIKSGECLPSRSTPLHAGDFLVLVRRRGDFMGHMARALKRKGIPLAGIDRFDLKSPLVISDLINMARFACLPSDDFILACVLKSPFCGLEEKPLMDLCTQRSGSLWDHIRQGNAVGDTMLETLRGALRRADYMPPFEFFSHLLVHGGRKALLERLGEEADDAIDVFLGQCLVYERSHVPSLDGFLQWFEQGDVDVQRDAEGAGDKVRIMTIHGAKGLQAPVVYLPDLVGIPAGQSQFIDMERAQNGARSTVPIFRRASGNDVGPIKKAVTARKDSDYAEYKRLLYVAMTRAEDHLICCGFKNAKPKEGEAPPKPDNRKDAYTLIEDAFKALANIEEMAGGVQRFAGPQKAPMAAKKVAPKTTSALPAAPKWIANAAPQEAAPPRPLQPSDPGIALPRLFDDSAAEQTLSPAQRGTLVHSLLEHLHAIAPEAREGTARAFLQGSLPGVGADLIEDLLRQSINTLAIPALAPLFAPGSRAEVPLVARLGDFIVSGQIDRLAVEETRILFVDYKTNAAPPAARSDIPAAYLRQMALYSASLAQMFPGKEITGALVWTANSQANWLTQQELTAHLPPSANSAF